MKCCDSPATSPERCCSWANQGTPSASPSVTDAKDVTLNRTCIRIAGLAPRTRVRVKESVAQPAGDTRSEGYLSHLHKIVCSAQNFMRPGY